MAVAFDASSVGAGDDPSWSHTCTGSDRLLVVFTGNWVGSDTEEVTAVTYNGVALTRHSVHAWNTGYISMWYLIGPATGAHTIAVTTTASNQVSCVASSWTGVDQSTPLGTPVANTGASATPTNAVTVQTGNYALDGVAALADNLTAGAGQTDLGFLASGHGDGCDSSYKAGTGSSMTMSWSGYVTDNRWASLAVEIKQVAVVSANTRSLLGVGA